MTRMFTRLFLSLALFLAATAAIAQNSAPPDYRFKVEVLAEGMPQPMELEVAPDGRVFYNEINGKLLLWKPDSREVVTSGEIPVFTAQENGFLGFALDPSFAQNQFIYLFYSPTNYPGARLSRFRMQGDSLDRSSEKVVLEFPEQRRDCCHHAGSVEFGPDGLLFISTGDNTHPGGDSDGLRPLTSGRTGRFSTRKNPPPTRTICAERFCAFNSRRMAAIPFRTEIFSRKTARKGGRRYS